LAGMDDYEKSANDIVTVVNQNIALFDEVIKLRDLIHDIVNELADPLGRYEFKVSLTPDTRNRINDVLNGEWTTRDKEQYNAADKEGEEGEKGDEERIWQKER